MVADFCPFISRCSGVLSHHCPIDWGMGKATAFPVFVLKTFFVGRDGGGVRYLYR